MTEDNNRMNRSRLVRKRIRTQGFGSLYVSVDFDDAGRVIGAALHTPGKFAKSDIGIAIEKMSQALDSLIKEGSKPL